MSAREPIKPSLLFLAHRIPYPPNKGDKIRSFNLLKALARDYRIYLGAFVDDKNDWAYQAELRKYCAEVFLLGISAGRKYLTVSAFARQEALTLPYYRQRRMQRWVDEKIKRGVERVFVYSSAMAQYVSGDAYAKLHRVIDFVDVDSEKWREYSRRRGWPVKWLYQREADQLFKYDRRIAAEFDASIFVSEPEARLFRHLAPDLAAKLGYLNNGVDSPYFDPAQAVADPYPADAKVLVFTGAMDYWANVDAVDWFARKIFVAIRAQVPQARFYIVGARPTEAVTRLEQIEGVKVTGAVRDIRPYLGHAVAAVAPMRIARGVQNKVLEAMAMAKPVLATTAAMEGIHPLAGQPPVDTEAALVAAAVRLLREGDTQGLGPAGRKLVLSEFNWDNTLLQLHALIDSPGGSAGTTASQGIESLKLKRTPIEGTLL